MSRVATCLFVGLIVACVLVGTANAQEPHKAWWNYFEGEWTYEITPLNLKGTASWTPVAKGNGMMSRHNDEGGQTAIAIVGWRPDKKSVVASGYGSEGNYYHIQYNEITNDTMKGTNHGVLPDGKIFDGKFTLEKVNNNRFNTQFKGKVGDEELTITGTYDRKMSEVAAQGMPEYVRDTLGKIVGDWRMESDDDEKKVVSDVTVTWANDKSLLVFTWRGTDVVSGRKTSSTGIIGWDAARQLVVEHEISADGSTFQGTHHIFKDGSWLSPYQGSMVVDGKPLFFETHRKFEILSDDEWTVTGGNWTQSDEPQPDRKTTFRRK